MRLTKEQKMEVCVKYCEGKNSYALSREYGVTPQSIRGILIRGGVPRRSLSEAKRTCLLNHEAFSKVTPDSAYWAGFLMADGAITTRSNSSPLILLGLCAKDRKHLLKFRLFLGSTHAVTRGIVTFCGKKHTRYVFGVRSRQIADDLRGYGVVPRKTERAEATELVNASRDFWRGVVDGDGCLRISSYPRMELLGSLPLVSQFLSFLNRNGIVTTAKAHGRGGYFVTALSGSFVVDAVRLLYGNCNVALDRKLKIAHDILHFRPIAAQQKKAD